MTMQINTKQTNNEIDAETETEVEAAANAYIINEDMYFPKASVDPKLIRLQKEVIDFVTSIILKHEKYFYVTVQQHFPSKLESILGEPSKTIIEMILEVINKLYNQIYHDIQNNQPTALATIILDMTEFTDYGPHILLDKLARLTLDAHLEISREQLVIDDIDLYEKSVLGQLNIYLLSKNLLHAMSKGPNDDTPFVALSSGQKAFNITVNKVTD